MELGITVLVVIFIQGCRSVGQYPQVIININRVLHFGVPIWAGRRFKQFPHQVNLRLLKGGQQ